ncbi:MAG: carboxypeptidase-like regulatory domain-containing protein, partial [Acidobacteriota bacterium]|nr:carboxypeptidase-like regulatory domain-containing protein [Acidobacteriota bacterium]
MKQRGIPKLGALGVSLVLCAMSTSLGASSADAQKKVAATSKSSAASNATSGPGKLAGVVLDGSGTPQMGASVELMAEASGLTAARELLTNTQGIFRGEKLAPGLYTVRVTLAGFLPTLEKHVRINPNITTVVRVQLESMFASLEQLRRQPVNIPVEGDDWKWVLRSASATRPVLEWVSDTQIVQVADASRDRGRTRQPRARLEFTDGARHPGSGSNLVPAPATAFAYDQRLGGTSRIILAGQMSYDQDAPAGSIATVWLPTGSLGAGPHTALVLREAKLGPEGQIFRGVRIDQGGAIALGDRAILSYGGEYVLVGLGAAASSLRPRTKLNVRVNDDWNATLVFTSLPNGPGPLEAEDGDAGNNALAATLNELDGFPTLLWRGGKPVLQHGWHEEIAAERKLGTRGKVQVAGFHDDNRHVAVFGRGNGLPASDYFQDYFSNGFAYDGGSSSSWGTRVALREKLDDDIELTAVYAFAGALAPGEDMNGVLRDVLRTAPRHSLGASVSAKVPRAGTRVEAGYKWISGVTVSRVDLYGESVYQLDPYLHV